jgi:hypothetical protein
MEWIIIINVCIKEILKTVCSTQYPLFIDNCTTTPMSQCPSSFLSLNIHLPWMHTLFCLHATNYPYMSFLSLWMVQFNFTLRLQSRKIHLVLRIGNKIIINKIQIAVFIGKVPLHQTRLITDKDPIVCHWNETRTIFEQLSCSCNHIFRFRKVMYF